MGGTMAKIRYGKGGCWIWPVGVLLSLFAVITAQPGFLSINCGGKTNYTDENNIKWVTDTDYIDVGDTAEDIGNVNAFGSLLHSLRFFPKPLTKSCYQLPVPSNMPYLLRLEFIIGNYSGFQRLPSFAYSFETVDMLAMRNITLPNIYGLYDEIIMATSGTVMYVCLIRTSESDDPFISGIELRPLRDGMYAQAKPGTLLITGKRYNIGGESMVRYPQDNFDRIWRSDFAISFNDKNVFRPVSSGEPISTNNTEDLPPTAVMQTALVANSSDNVNFSLQSSQGSKTLLLLYFAELETLNMSESRSFYFAINGETVSETITLVRNYSAVELELTFVSNESDYFELWKAANSTHNPIINAYEHYWLIDTQPATYSQDIEALDAIKRSFDIKDWISDPCYLIQWKGIGCDNKSTSGIRISEIDLSRRNLTGSVPNEIVHLTALVNVSLDNNHLMGQLPYFSNLTMLERLHLQNNNLSGTVPEWLSELKNLKELNIENNNFSGGIPAQLLRNCSLKLTYSGNPFLLMDKRECTLQNSNSNKLKDVLRITLGGGISIIALALIVGFVVYRKKITRKEKWVATESRGVEMEPRPFLYQDYSRIMVPNPRKSRAFSLDEMVAATQTFL